MTEAKTFPDSLRPYLAAIFERKPLSVSAIDVQELTSYTDTLVIVEAASHRQTASLAQHILKSLKEKKIRSLGSEGVKEGEWALLDYGDTVIHVFESDARRFYDLEGFWSDAPRYDLTGISGPIESGADNTEEIDHD